MRNCNVCKELKPLTTQYFHRNRCQRDGFRLECKDCAKTIDRLANAKYYIQNSEKKKEKVKQRRTEIIKFIEIWKKDKVCCRCNESDHRTFEFHRRDPFKKDLSIGKVAKHGWSIKRVIEEIEKCELLCANCHRIVDNVYNTKSRQTRHQSATEYILKYKSEHPCKCGMNDIRTLEFHHRDPTTKLFNIGDIRFSLKTVILEIQKCDITCANCHRKTHYVDIRPEFRRTA